MMQRKGKTHKASGSDQFDGMKSVVFFKQAAEELGNAGEVDAAFYFEQVESWLRDGNSLPTEGKAISKVLGL